MNIKLKASQIYAIPALLLMLLGIFVLAGWVFGSQSLVRVLPTLRLMVVATAFCFLLASVNFLADGYVRQQYVNLIRSLTSYLMLLISLLVISTYLFDTTTYIDFPVFHRKLVDDDMRPGLMGANTAVCFLMSSLALIALIKQPVLMLRARIVKLLAACVFLVGFIGFFGYIFNIRELYGWAGAARMAVHTALGMMVLGIGLYIKLSNQLKFLDEIDEQEETITTVIFFTLFLSSISIAVIAFGFLQDKTISFVKKSYIQQVEQRTLFFDQIIYHRSKRATTFLGNVVLADAAKKILENNPISTKAALEIAALAKENEFSAIYVLQSNDRKTPIFVGTIATPAISIDLKGKNVRNLIWDKGYVLQSIFDIPSKDDAKIVFEQPLTVLNQLDKNWMQTGVGKNQLICGNASTGLACFPDRFHQHPFYISNYFYEFERPVSMALKNQTGVVRFYDEEKYQIISAYRPIGDVGLGLSLAVSVRDLYSPIINSFIFTILFTILVLFVSYWMIKSKANPLIEKIFVARKTAEIERNRFIAATEGGLDSFYICEAVRDDQQQIIDFRFVFLNTSACKLINKTPNDIVGKLLFEELPFMKQKKYFSRFKYVVETGQTIAEEINVDEDKIGASWLYWQIVKLDDGFSITSRDVTDRHDMLQSLAESKEHVQQILKNQNVATFILDAHHRVTHWNLACEQLTGIQASRMIGSRAAWQAFYASQRPCLADLIVDGQKNKAAEYYDKQGASPLLESGWHAEAWFENLGGKRRYVIFDAAPIFDADGKIIAAIETLQDVTDAKLVEQALNQEKQNLDAVIEGTNAGTWQWNITTGELRFNEKWATMLGYQQSAISDTFVDEWQKLIHPDDADMVKENTEKHCAGETTSFEAEFRMRHKQGHWVWIYSHGRIVNKTNHDDSEWMFGTHVDITTRKQAELELKQAYNNLEEFTAVASHDLKSPLRGIADLMEWIEEDLGNDIPDDVKNNLNRVQLRVKKMGTLIDDLLAYSKAGIVTNEEQLLDVDEMLNEIVELQYIPTTFKVQIDCKVKPFKTNETPLKTIVRNLISNAIKHHDKESGHIDVNVSARNEFYVFEIKDDGPGIPEEMHGRVFKLFQTLSKHEGSSGLGLAVSKRMAEVHGGYLELESDVEKRVTIFRLYWPKLIHRELATYK